MLKRIQSANWKPFNLTDIRARIIIHLTLLAQSSPNAINSSAKQSATSYITLQIDIIVTFSMEMIQRNRMDRVTMALQTF